MATSSILENIRVNNPKAVEEFVLAMEDSAKSPLTSAMERTSSVVSDPVRLKAIVAKGLSNRGDR